MSRSFTLDPHEQEAVMDEAHPSGPTPDSSVARASALNNSHLTVSHGLGLGVGVATAVLSIIAAASVISFMLWIHIPP